MKIDAHQHFWRLARGDYGWLTAAEHPLICRDFMPADLAPLLRERGVEATILVQAAPTAAETAFLLDLAAQTPFVAGVVGWTDLAASDAPQAIDRLAQNERLVGLRPMLQDLSDDAWILSPALAPAIAAMEAAGLRFDALVKPRHLPVLARFLARHPDLPVVIDHAAKPDIAGGVIEPWAALMRAIAADTSAFCKLSGLATEAGHGWTAGSLRPFVDVLLDAFGPSRLMWGSDWPVLLEAGDYRRWAAAADELLANLPGPEREAIFGPNAAAFYALA